MLHQDTRLACREQESRGDSAAIHCGRPTVVSAIGRNVWMEDACRGDTSEGSVTWCGKLGGLKNRGHLKDAIDAEEKERGIRGCPRTTHIFEASGTTRQRGQARSTILSVCLPPKSLAPRTAEERLSNWDDPAIISSAVRQAHL